MQRIGAMNTVFSLLPSVHHIWMRTLASKLGSVVQLHLFLKLLCNLTHFDLHTSLGIQSLQKHRTDRSNSGSVFLPPLKNTKQDILRQNWVSFMSKITGYRLLVIPCKQTRRYCAGIVRTLLHLAEQVFWGFCSIKPSRIHLNSRQNFFPPFHASGYLHVELKEIPLSTLRISNRASREASAKRSVTALFLRWLELAL